VPTAEQQHEGPLHRDHRHRRGRDVRGLGIVDPQHAADLPDGLEPVRQRPKRAQPFPDQPRRYARFVNGKRGRERVRHVVVAEQMQVVTRDQRLAADVEHASLGVVPGIRRFGEREQHSAPSDPAREIEHQPVIRIEHPDVALGCVAKQQSLVGVVRLRRGIAVQVIGREVREHADFGREVGAVVQLK